MKKESLPFSRTKYSSGLHFFKSLAELLFRRLSFTWLRSRVRRLYLSMAEEDEVRQCIDAFYQDRMEPGIPERIVSKLEEIEQKLNFVSESFQDLTKKVDLILEKIGVQSPNELKRRATQLIDPPKRTKLDETDSSGFHLENGKVVVYTDGCCINNGKKFGTKAGIGVWFADNHPLNLSEPVEGPATNNNAEIQSATKAIHQATNAGVDRLCIYTDSQFLISCITQWIHKWKKNNWVLAGGGPVKNKEELVKLDNAIKKLKEIEWKHVRGHVGVMGNERADALAKNGAQRYVPS